MRVLEITRKASIVAIWRDVFVIRGREETREERDKSVVLWDLHQAHILRMELGINLWYVVQCSRISAFKVNMHDQPQAGS